MTGSSHNRRRLASVDARILLVALLACGGQNATEPPVGTGSGDAYRGDIDKLCDVMARSGAATADPNDKTYVSAMWLSANLTTPESRKFLQTIQPLEGEAKASALEAEAHRVGLSACALAVEWRKPRSP